MLRSTTLWLHETGSAKTERNLLSPIIGRCWTWPRADPTDGTALHFGERVWRVHETTGRDVSGLLGPCTLQILRADYDRCVAEYAALGGTVEGGNNAQ